MKLGSCLSRVCHQKRQKCAKTFCPDDCSFALYNKKTASEEGLKQQNSKIFTCGGYIWQIFSRTISENLFYLFIQFTISCRNITRTCKSNDQALFRLLHWSVTTAVQFLLRASFSIGQHHERWRWPTGSDYLTMRREVRFQWQPIRFQTRGPGDHTVNAPKPTGDFRAAVFGWL